MSKKEEDKELDILEENIMSMQDILEQLTTHRNRLMYGMKKIEDTLETLVENAAPSGEEGIVNVNPNDLADLAEVWFDGLDAVGVCYEDIGNFMERQKVIVAYILAKAVIKKENK